MVPTTTRAWLIWRRTSSARVSPRHEGEEAEEEEEGGEEKKKEEKEEEKEEGEKEEEEEEEQEEQEGRVSGAPQHCPLPGSGRRRLPPPTSRRSLGPGVTHRAVPQPATLRSSLRVGVAVTTAGPPQQTAPLPHTPLPAAVACPFSTSSSRPRRAGRLMASCYAPKVKQTRV